MLLYMLTLLPNEVMNEIYSYMSPYSKLSLVCYMGNQDWIFDNIVKENDIINDAIANYFDIVKDGYVYMVTKNIYGSLDAYQYTIVIPDHPPIVIKYDGRLKRKYYIYDNTLKIPIYIFKNHTIKVCTEKIKIRSKNYKIVNIDNHMNYVKEYKKKNAHKLNIV